MSQIQKPWGPCFECMAQGVTCCSRPPRVPLTIEDIERIESVTKMPVMDFAAAAQYPASHTEGDEPWWIDALAVIEGIRYRANVRTDARGKCFFLMDGKGCTLGDKRPYVCRIYPFWVENDVVVYESGDPECSAEKHGISVKDAIHIFGETEASIRWFFDRIKEDAEKQKGVHRILALCLQAYGNHQMSVDCLKCDTVKSLPIPWSCSMIELLEEWGWVQGDTGWLCPSCAPKF